MSSNQCFFKATLPSATKLLATLPLAFLTASRSTYDFVSGRHSRKMMISTGGQAPNQKRGRQPWGVVSTRARANTVASRYPKA